MWHKMSDKEPVDGSVIYTILTNPKGEGPETIWLMPRDGLFIVQESFAVDTFGDDGFIKSRLSRFEDMAEKQPVGKDEIFAWCLFDEYISNDPDDSFNQYFKTLKEAINGSTDKAR